MFTHLSRDRDFAREIPSPEAFARPCPIFFLAVTSVLPSGLFGRGALGSFCPVTSPKLCSSPLATRRAFLKVGATTAGFLGLRALLQNPLAASLAESAGGPGAAARGFGPLLPDPAGLFDLPAGFSYVQFSRHGEEMDDGLLVPGMHDGMAAFPGPDGRVLLVRNHENESAWTDFSPFGRDRARLGRVDPAKLYDRGRGEWPNLGGTTTLVYDPATRRMERHFLSLAGTVRNCAGGPTPWGTWITCEEVNDLPEPYAEQPHGFNFEVRPSAVPGLVTPVPLKAMGRFRHEAICVHPASGAVYQTEDIGDGLLYRFLPAVPGDLAAGGRLQALVLRDQHGAATRNWDAPLLPVGRALAVRWIDLDEVESPLGDLRLRGFASGAALFARGEGAWWGEDAAWFAMTNGGPSRLGQIFRYRPSEYEGTAREEDAPATIELFVEPNDSELVSNADNLCVAPWGDLVLCEDTKGVCRLVGVTPRGDFYVLGRNARPGRELAGACFSPDGSTLFVNVQNPGYTLAIHGPWRRA
jgi:secreted PhoX family phosphatase